MGTSRRSAASLLDEAGASSMPAQLLLNLPAPVEKTVSDIGGGPRRPRRASSHVTMFSGSLRESLAVSETAAGPCSA